VHIFDCALTFRRQFGITWDYEIKPGVPKPGWDMDGEKQRTREEIEAEEEKAKLEMEEKHRAAMKALEGT
jgi:hypothetical protein